MDARRPGPLGLALAAALAFPAALAAQDRSCELVTAARLEKIAAGTLSFYFFSGPVEFRCDGGVVVRADSAVGTQGVAGGQGNTLELVGAVFYGDPLKTLTADWVTYWGREGRVHARGRVVLSDRASRSVVRGAELTYERQRPGRPESRTVVPPGPTRPHATLFPRRTARPAPADTAAQPFEVDADWMEILGQRAFRASGRVEIVRGATRAWANWAEYDQTHERLVLNGQARIQSDSLELRGEAVEARLEGDRLREVVARVAAHLTGRDLRVEAPELRLFFEEDRLHRLVARAAPGAWAAPGPGAAQARATARDLLLVADSIDALAPGQRLERAAAVGRAYAERAPDPLRAGLPDPASRDWLRGDTILAHFTERKATPPAARPTTADGPAPATDTTRADPMLERLVAIGPEGRARALYRVPRRKGEGTRAAPSVTYTVADRITLQLRNGEVQEAEAQGRIRGIHLEPASARTAPRPAPRPPAGAGPDPER